MKTKAKKEENTQPKDPAKEKLKEANTYLGFGAGIGALGVGSALTIGATCPLCVIAAPALIGAGIIGRSKARKIAASSCDTCSSIENDSE